MNSSVIDNIMQRLIDLRIIMREEFVGCTRGQIEEIKGAQNVLWLPNIYEQFLLKMGQFSGRFLRVEFWYPVLLEQKDNALDMLDDFEAPLELPPDALVIYAGGQGYEFFFFRTKGFTEDPPVYYYLEGYEEFLLRWETLSSFFLAEYEQCVRAYLG